MNDDRRVVRQSAPARLVSALAGIIAVKGSANGLQQEFARIDVTKFLVRGQSSAVGKLL